MNEVDSNVPDPAGCIQRVARTLLAVPTGAGIHSIRANVQYLFAPGQPLVTSGHLQRGLRRWEIPTFLWTLVLSRRPAEFISVTSMPGVSIEVH